MYTLTTLGACELHGPEGEIHEQMLSQPRRLALLIYLSASRREYLYRASVAALFWPNASDSHARGALKQAVFAIRRTLGADVVLARGSAGLSVNRNRIECDVQLFRKAMVEGRFSDAAGLYGGQFLESFNFGNEPGFRSWAISERSIVEAGYRFALQATHTGYGVALQAHPHAFR